MNPPSSPQTFRMVKKRAGGTFTFSPDPVPSYDVRSLGPDLIGTYGCANAVGLYFKIDKIRCFMAHMPVKVRMARPEDTEEPDDRSVSAEEGAQLKVEVLVRLQAEAEQHGWFPPSFEREVMICCPFIRQDKGKHRYAMYYVVEGIRAFLGRGDLRVEDVEGFVVDHRNGHVVQDGWFKLRGNGEVGTEPEQVANGVFVAKSAKGYKPRDWSFEVVREEMLEPLGAKKTVAKKRDGRSV